MTKTLLLAGSFSLSLLGCATNAAMMPPPSTTAAPDDPSDTLTITSDDDYIARGFVLLDQMTAAFQAAGSDCAKLANGLDAFGAQNRPVLRGVAAYDRLHPDAKPKFNAAAKPKLDAFDAIAMQSLKTCESDPRVKDAVAKLGT